MPNPGIQHPPSRGAEPRLDGLAPAARPHLQVAAHAIRDGNETRARHAPDAAFALGKVCEDQGHYEQAFTALTQANAELRQLHPWNAGAFRAHAHALAAASVRLPPRADPALGREAIFIVGLPRSGSSLFEQILAAHPEVEGASELPDLEQVLGEESARRRLPLLQWIAAATAADWRRLGQRYLELTARAERYGTLLDPLRSGLGLPPYAPTASVGARSRAMLFLPGIGNRE